MDLRSLIDDIASGRMGREDAERYLSSFGILEIGLHRVDQSRDGRTAAPECIYGESKSAAQLVELCAAFADRDLPLLATRVDEAKAESVMSVAGGFAWSPVSRLLRRGALASPAAAHVAVISAGSSDLPVAEEAAGTLEFFGHAVSRVYDCGVAGLHRLFARGDVLTSADVLIVVAGMDGALPSVVGGAFRAPIIAVPTSVGYGASFGGVAALLTMLNSCAPGVTVVNIDNGFGAAVAARAILRLVERRTTSDRDSRIAQEEIQRP